MVLASRTDRFVAQILDGFTAVVPIFFLGLVMVFMGDPDDWVIGMFAIAAILFLISYHLFCDSLPNGQSVGKQVMGIAVVDRHSGRPCSAGQSFVRNLLLTVLGFFDWIFILGDKRCRLGDMAAGTVVVEVAPDTRPTYNYIPSLDN